MIKHLVLAAATASLSSPLLAAEKTVDFTVDSQKVVGTLNIPDGVSKPPVVLLLHGFTGSRNELEIPAVKEGVFSRAARMWADRGVASLRIDFRGNGESEGKFEDMTMEGLIGDAEAALDYLGASPDVDGDKMAIVGWSMGGAVAASVAGRTEHDLDSVALWAPATNMGSSLALLDRRRVYEGWAGGEGCTGNDEAAVGQRRQTEGGLFRKHVPHRSGRRARSLRGAAVGRGR